MAEGARLWRCVATARSMGRLCRRWRISFVDRDLCFAHASPEERERCQATRRAGDEARRALRRAA